MRKLLTTLQILIVTGLLVGSTALLVLSLPGSGWKALSVQTGSMKPAINPGDLVLAHSVPASQLKVGDVITYVNPKDKTQTITHRIVEVKTSLGGVDRFVAKGDANATADRVTVYGSQIVGLSQIHIPKLGWLFDWLRTWPGLITTIYIPALIVVALEIRKLSRYYKSLEPYVKSGFAPKPPSTSRHTIAKASAAAVVIAGTVITPTVQAAMLSSATLGVNLITTAPATPVTPPLNHPLISKVAFGGNGSGSSSTNINVINNNNQSASSGNASGSGATSGNASNSNNQSVTVNVGNSGGNTSTPAIISIYNPTDSPVDLSGWTLLDNGLPQIIPNSTIVASKATHNFTWPVTDGLSRNSDRLVLRSPSAATVDSLSWGSDTSQLNPAIATAASTAIISRSDLTSDHDTASDWQTIP